MNADLAIPRGDVHLWVVRENEIEPDLLKRLAGFLSSEECAQARRFVFDVDQRRYVTTRALVRTTLSRYQSVAPDQWRFRPGTYGRPEIVNPGCDRLLFNVSHSKGMIVCAVSMATEVGVDVEDTSRPVSVDLADRYFSRAEAAELRKRSVFGRRRNFFEYWTLKEAYIKARGKGMSIPLDRFSFNLSTAGYVRFQVEIDVDDDPDSWGFCSFQLKPQYLVALCAKRSSDQNVLLRNVVPLVSEQIVSVPVLRSSATEVGQPLTERG